MSTREKKTKTEELREKQATRLNHCLEIREMIPADLIHNYYDEHHMTIPSSHLSMILSAKRSLPHDYAIAFSKYLKIDSGFLLGIDGFQCESYNDYLIYMDKTEKIEKYGPDLQRKADVLKLAGYGLIANFDVPVTEKTSKGAYRKPFKITISNGKKSADILYGDMEEIEDRVRRLAAALIDEAIIRNQYKSTTIEELEKTRQKVMKK